jgi:hypothetical protein
VTATNDTEALALYHELVCDTRRVGSEIADAMGVITDLGFEHTTFLDGWGNHQHLARLVPLSTGWRIHMLDRSDVTGESLAEAMQLAEPRMRAYIERGEALRDKLREAGRHLQREESGDDGNSE